MMRPAAVLCTQFSLTVKPCFTRTGHHSRIRTETGKTETVTETGMYRLCLGSGFKTGKDRFPGGRYLPACQPKRTEAETCLMVLVFSVSLRISVRALGPGKINQNKTRQPEQVSRLNLHRFVFFPTTWKTIHNNARSQRKTETKEAQQTSRSNGRQVILLVFPYNFLMGFLLVWIVRLVVVVICISPRQARHWPPCGASGAEFFPEQKSPQLLEPEPKR